MKIKNNVFHKQSIIQSTLFKLTFSIFVFLILFILFYGQNYWEKEALKLKDHLLLNALNVQSKIQSRIRDIDGLKQDRILTKDQKVAKINTIIQSIISDKNENAVIMGYYDLDLAVMIKNTKEDFSFERIPPVTGTKNEISNLSWKTKSITVNIPVYDQDKLVGYVWAYAKNSDNVFKSFQNLSEILILTLGLSALIMFFIRKAIKQIELYLDKFCQTIKENDYEQEQILTKLPELKPVLDQITCYTDELKQMNLELESSNLKTTKIMEGISDGFYALDRDWLFTFVNSETQKLIGKENTELLGRSIWEVFPHIVGSLTYDKMQEAMSEDESIHWQAEGFATLEQYYEYHAYPFKEGLTVFFRDITELKRQQQELARLERLNLIGQLAAGISHEIRNPLTTIKGFLQLLGSKSKYDQDKEYLDLMLSEIDRANTIITDFLSLAKANLDNIKPQNLNEIINKISPMLRADAYNNNKEVVLDLNSLPDIRLNENEIKQLILNLVRNGLEVTPEAGNVTIWTYQKEDKVVLAVKDQGTGIPLDIQKKIGTPFFTTKESGTGLGLAISIGIAQRHNATFEFETGNDGTTFYITFPTEKVINTLATC